MRLLVTGPDGMLGRDLIEQLNGRHEIEQAPLAVLDVTDREAARSVVKSFRPDAVINCAAYTNVEMAEDEPRIAYAVNAFGPQNLALACHESGADLYHVSTDYVFDGSRSSYSPFDATGPINVYGQSKLAGERLLEWCARRFCIVRTSWLYGRHGVNFVEKILQRAEQTAGLRVVNDQVGAPTWTVNLAGALVEMVERRIYGVYHYTDDAGSGVSWYDFALESLKLAGKNQRVAPVSSGEFKTKARRPAHSTLDCSLTDALGIRQMDWKDSLARYMKARG